LFRDVDGPALALRLIPHKVPDAKTLGLSEPVQRLSNLNKGLVIVSGPSGSGRSTTLACLLELVNHSRSDYIITVEDAVEFTMEKASCVVRQRAVGRDRQLQKQAIEAALQQSPEILMVGELWDTEVTELVLEAACGGKLVFASLHTPMVVDTIDHIIESFPLERQQRVRERLADCLKAVVCQTLLKASGGGRVAAIESLFVNPAVAAIIREDRTAQIPGAMKSGRYGQVLHNDALIKLILAQRVEPLEAYLRCHDRESFIAACKKAEIPFDPRSDGKVTEN
jgi:twitching motility protein PilT